MGTDVMRKKILKFKKMLITLLILALFCPCTFARREERREGEGREERGEHWEERREHRHEERYHERRHHRRHRYFYRDGRWHRHSWFGFNFIVSALAVGAIVESLPPRHSVIIVRGVPYYYDDRYYYKELPDGDYEVVPSPLATQPDAQTTEEITINIPNLRGGYTSVTLKKSGTGYIGPQGEFYRSFPSVKQLEKIYGNR